MRQSTKPRRVCVVFHRVIPGHVISHATGRRRSRGAVLTIDGVIILRQFIFTIRAPIVSLRIYVLNRFFIWIRAVVQRTLVH